MHVRADVAALRGKATGRTFVLSKTVLEDKTTVLVDVRDLVEAHRLAAESSIEHSKTLGGSRYIMHGSGGLSAIRLGTDIVDIIRKAFPENSVGKPETVTSKGDTIKLESRLHNDSKKAKSLLKARLRPVEETIKDVVQSSFDLGVITPVKKE